VKVLDVNIVVYAHHVDSPQHDTARAWMDAALGGTETIGLPLVTSLGFLRLMTNPQVIRPALMVNQAMAILERLTTVSVVHTITPRSGHWARVAELAADAQVRGAGLTDAHLAALAIERGATLVSHDKGFRRFTDLDLFDPVD
jgi:toxin-antitoxin system PIN domain toxin